MNDRATFAADELAVVLSHYDLGTIRGIKEFPRGSRQSPKVLIRARAGDFLLKRRALGKNDPFKVAFSHALQLYLTRRDFPLPHLIGTREHNNSMLQSGAHVYELFEYIRGEAYSHSVEETAAAGRALALYHRLVREYVHEFEPPKGSYHASSSIDRGFEAIPETFRRLGTFSDEASAEQVATNLTYLRDSYAEAGAHAAAAGLAEWPLQIVHCDWHPGNMIFRAHEVVAVIDYDVARLQQRAIDVANGVLQFSMLGGGADTSLWPAELDAPRYAAFVRGYDAADPLSPAERAALPSLMIEALIAEAVTPISAAGSFGRLPGVPFLQMVERKVRFLKQHADNLGAAAEP